MLRHCAALVHDSAPGDLVGTSADRRSDPRSAYQRVAHLSADQQLSHFNSNVGLHQQVPLLGRVASDLYDGSLIVDFGTGKLTLIDMDSYQRGPGVNTMGRMFGSTRGNRFSTIDHFASAWRRLETRGLLSVDCVRD